MTTVSGAQNSATRLATLDGLRGIAACGVAFCYHPLLELSPAVMARAPSPVVWLRDWGWTFVDLFFVVSGFIFAQVYLTDRRLRRSGMADFAVARFARLYPLHLLMLLTMAALCGAAPENTAHAFAAHLLMLQAFVDPVAHTFDGPAWSISVEIVCYVLFALGVARGDRALRWITGGAICAAVLHLLVLGRAGGPWAGDFVPRGLLGFFVGQVLWRQRVILARVPGIVLLAVMAIGLRIDMGERSSLLPLALLVWPAALCFALRLPALASRPLLWLGDRSYAIYLIHFPILLVLVPWLKSAQGGWTAAAVMSGFASFVLIVSDLVYRHFEVPVREGIRRVWRRRQASSPNLAAS